MSSSGVLGREDIEAHWGHDLDLACDVLVNDCLKRLHWCHSQLVTVVHISTLMAFFSITAAVELQIGANIPSESLMVAYVCTTCLLVGVTILVKIAASTILPHLESISVGASDYSNMLNSEVFRSPHDQLFDLITFICLLGHTFAPFLFCLDLILIAWIKFFHFSREAPMAVTAIMVPVQVAIIFFGRAMFRRTRKFREEHKLPLTLGPSRRYSEIAETWDENEDISNHSSYSEESSLLNSYRSNTSYGAVAKNGDNFSQITVLADCHY